MFQKPIAVFIAFSWKLIVESSIPGLRWARLSIVAEGPLAQWCHLTRVAPQSGSYCTWQVFTSLASMNKSMAKGVGMSRLNVQPLNTSMGLFLCVPIYHLFEEGTVVKPRSRNHIIEKHAWSLWTCTGLGALQPKPSCTFLAGGGEGRGGFITSRLPTKPHRPM